jgi:cytochrome c2
MNTLPGYPLLTGAPLRVLFGALFSALVGALSCAGCSQALPTHDEATGGNPRQGRETIVRYGCGACHTIDGVPNARGLVGPPLAGIGERSYIAGHLPTTAENLMRWIEHPQRFDPQSAMPELGVTQADARDIVAYLLHQP